MSKHGPGGRLYNRFRYLRTVEKLRMQSNGAPALPQTDYVAESGQNDDVTGDLKEKYKDDLLYLKTVVVTSENLADIRKILGKTRIVRDEMMRDYLENFPILFVCPNLVCIQIIYFGIVHILC